MIVSVTDARAEELADYTRLTDVRLRTRLEPEQGLYMAESTQVIMRAIAAGHRPRSFLMAPRWLPVMEPAIAASCGSADGGATPVYVAEEPVLEAITGFHLHRGALAAMHRPHLAPMSKILGAARGGAGARRVAVLEDIVDHTNVGAVFRSAAALGVDAVLVSPSCADPLYRRAVRVSMGTVFQVPWTRVPEWPAGVSALQGLGFTVAALALREDAVDLDAFAQSVAGPGSRVALVLGTEGDGLKRGTVDAADIAVRIPMSGEVDSLNVAAASAVAFWATRVTGQTPPA
ncbi:TrmH family RNA methyltransferase [Bogoriella caseilytica]|uniref:tRNA G18 (Ribose-2'-O)-methylase SpoU n=1 Tax=Bogoriella caseilytica TaxID=56055 RepID=A0A3N2BGC3_9MICO|nr:RNA methyltransferase [Bogoriella caseilytica]ROR74268.1 tRNA G18 (ribose-2'-O)-methylase SpoU [Bogoriella caseilytica]